MANFDHDLKFSTERGSELPISVRRDDQRTAANPSPVWFKRIWSTIIVLIARQNPPESPDISMGNIEHGLNNPSEIGGHDAISIRDADEYSTSSSLQEFVSCNGMDDPDTDSSIVNGEDAVSFNDEEFAADRQSSEFEPANSQDYPGSTSTRIEYAEQDSGLLTETSEQIETSARDEEHTTTELQSHPISKFDAVVYSLIVNVLFIKGLIGKHSPSTEHNPFMMISIGAFLPDILILFVKSYIYERFRISSHQCFSCALYYTFYILRFLALCSSLRVLRNLQL